MSEQVRAGSRFITSQEILDRQFPSKAKEAARAKKFAEFQAELARKANGGTQHTPTMFEGANPQAQAQGLNPLAQDFMAKLQQTIDRGDADNAQVNSRQHPQGTQSQQQTVNCYGAIFPDPVIFPSNAHGWKVMKTDSRTTNLPDFQIISPHEPLVINFFKPIFARGVDFNGLFARNGVQAQLPSSSPQGLGLHNLQQSTPRQGITPMGPPASFTPRSDYDQGGFNVTSYNRSRSSSVATTSQEEIRVAFNLMNQARARSGSMASTSMEMASGGAPTHMINTHTSRASSVTPRPDNHQSVLGQNSRGLTPTQSFGNLHHGQASGTQIQSYPGGSQLDQVLAKNVRDSNGSGFGQNDTARQSQQSRNMMHIQFPGGYAELIAQQTAQKAPVTTSASSGNHNGSFSVNQIIQQAQLHSQAIRTPNKAVTPSPVIQQAPSIIQTSAITSNSATYSTQYAQNDLPIILEDSRTPADKNSREWFEHKAKKNYYDQSLTFTPSQSQPSVTEQATSQTTSTESASNAAQSTQATIAENGWDDEAEAGLMKALGVEMSPPAQPEHEKDQTEQNQTEGEQVISSEDNQEQSDMSELFGDTRHDSEFPVYPIMTDGAADEHLKISTPKCLSSERTFTETVADLGPLIEAPSPMASPTAAHFGCESSTSTQNTLAENAEIPMLMRVGDEFYDINCKLWTGPWPLKTPLPSIWMQTPPQVATTLPLTPESMERAGSKRKASSEIKNNETTPTKRSKVAAESVMNIEDTIDWSDPNASRDFMKAVERTQSYDDRHYNVDEFEQFLNGGSFMEQADMGLNVFDLTSGAPMSGVEFTPAQINFIEELNEGMGYPYGTRHPFSDTELAVLTKIGTEVGPTEEEVEKMCKQNLK